MSDKRGDNRLQLLLLPYQPASFLINRLQCSSSIYIADTKQRLEDDQHPWLKETLISGDMELPLFDLDAFLHQTFYLEGDNPAQLALVRTFDSFSPQIMEKCYQYGLIETDALAFRVSSSTKMIDLGPEDFQLPPAVTAPFLSSRGIPALALPDSNQLRFLIDFDILFELAILEEPA